MSRLGRAGEDTCMAPEPRDKAIIVTGGARGIGAAIVRACHSEGAIPVIVDRDAEAGERLAAKLGKHGSVSKVVSAGLASAIGCAYALERTISNFGCLDGLVNHAGTKDFVSPEHGSSDDYVESIHRNLVHYYSMGWSEPLLPLVPAA